MGNTAPTESAGDDAVAFARVGDGLVEDVVTGSGGEPAALSASAASEGTARLFEVPGNARRLITAIKELEAGRGVERALIE
ncbi:type II toxin-antitoxin system prevent-host-death family antitoxin [Nocardiopsis mangrovi]|uniref:Type II toxin-antitoxin system prevent-host-death family antitoxin n=1 Tax=Nocardiopsis mangrovi TaxID=1179818 RepID=A0ABV9E0K7_9ACTN